jgi:TIR domain-containing protein
MNKLFISHSSQDDAFVRDLRSTLADHGQHGWIDSRELRGGASLLQEVQSAIKEASAYAVVVSPHSFQSDWVGDELAHALKVQEQRGRANYPVIPLCVDGTAAEVRARMAANFRGWEQDNKKSDDINSDAINDATNSANLRCTQSSAWQVVLPYIQF